jgi:hypothetical protein
MTLSAAIALLELGLATFDRVAATSNIPPTEAELQMRRGVVNELARLSQMIADGGDSPSATPPADGT